ncbi:MCE family protein [Nocardioides halotolerans]|jgi:phospholipid/cholesterol/gamma-HCH transport system substrate-binding protein|uniref:MCE family protein n=1 Tax=Nocardioides halotolerans TaxID=433660 RepID=UPI0003FAF8E6|nr:MCE family protein [Nocardioides halotolerans]
MSGVPAVFRDRLYLSAVGVLLVFVVGIAYLFGAVLDEPLTSRPDRVTVELSATGGLFEGSVVTYRGVKVGKVTRIVATGTGAEATVSLAGDAQVPRGTQARVRSLSPVGEQYLDFQPTTSSGPYLGDGDRVVADATDIPASLSSTVLAVGQVLDQIDARKLRRLLVALSTGLGGTGEDLGNLLDQGQAVLTDLDRAWPQTERLLRGSGPVLDLPVSSAGDLRALARSSRELAAFLRDYDPELRATLRRTPAEVKQLRGLIRDVASVLPGFLDTALPFTDELVAHDPHLRALLQSYAPGLGSLTEVIRNGELRLALIPDLDARCRYDVARRDPRDPTRRPLQDHGRCSASFAQLQRGAAHAPGPVALPRF